MLDEKKLINLRRTLKRIFALPINRTTYREVHSAILNAADGDIETANAFFEALLNGDSTSEKVKKFPKEDLKKIIDEFAVSAWAAKDVFEKGDFINLVTSDLISAPQQHVFQIVSNVLMGRNFILSAI